VCSARVGLHHFVLECFADPKGRFAETYAERGPNCAKRFEKLFKERVIDPVIENPRMLKKEFWE
jgi:hypothetical protein